MKTAFFSPKLQEHHQVSKNYNFYHFFGPYNPFEKMAFFGLDPLVTVEEDAGERLGEVVCSIDRSVNAS